MCAGLMKYFVTKQKQAVRRYFGILKKKRPITINSERRRKYTVYFELRSTSTVDTAVVGFERSTVFRKNLSGLFGRKNSMYKS